MTNTTSSAPKTFVGFGFGPIQSGLFAFEAHRSGNFARIVISEVDEALVAAVRQNGGRVVINVAGPDGVNDFELSGLELLNPRDTNDRQALIEAIRDSDEMATALPSVEFCGAGGDASVVSLLCDGLAARSAPLPTVIYAAENHNHAAEILHQQLADSACAHLSQVQCLNTVIGKMSGVISDAPTMHRLGLTPLAPGIERAILVEEFNRILVSRVAWPGYRRGITVFEEKPDLLPFEEAKLYGHNAIHALIAYLGDVKGYATMAEAGRDSHIQEVARRAFLNESGAALVHRHQNLDDALFTPDGWRLYAHDLLRRMANPHLNDLIERVGRDHARKLGYDDRLFGTMRLALDAGITPRYLAKGAAAGVFSLIKRRDTAGALAPFVPAEWEDLDENRLRTLLLAIWGETYDRNRDALLELTWQAALELREGNQ